MACIVAAGVTLFAVGTLFHLAIPVMAPDISPQFRNADLYRPWAGWTSTYMALHPFGLGAVFAAIYLALIARGGVAQGCHGGLLYGAGLFIAGSLPVYLLVFASFQVSREVITWWVAQSACQYTAAGLAVGWVAGQAKRARK